MLRDLNDLQEDTDETVRNIDMTFHIETMDSESNELIRKTYTFAYAEHFETWTFHEYFEERTDDTPKVSGRNWRQEKHVIWTDFTESKQIDVPPQVSNKLAEATGADSIEINSPQKN